MRKGRSVVHKNLEDNYGAVVIANHEALAQVLDQVCNNHDIFWKVSFCCGTGPQRSIDILRIIFIY